MMDAAKATTMARASQARKIMLNELLTSVLDEIRAVIDTDTFDPGRCNAALASLNEFLFQEFLGEQCAFQCVRGLSTPSGVAFFSPAGRRYSGTLELVHAASFAAEINEDRTVRVYKNQWGKGGQFSSLAAIEWDPGLFEYTFTTRLV